MRSTWRSDDVRVEFPDEPWSAYERKLTEQGACAFGIAACPGPAPEHVEQTAPLSLVSYLPDNLDQLECVRMECRAVWRTCATATPANAPAASRSSARR